MQLAVVVSTALAGTAVNNVVKVSSVPPVHSFQAISRTLRTGPHLPSHTRAITSNRHQGPTTLRIQVLRMVSPPTLECTGTLPPPTANPLQVCKIRVEPLLLLTE